MSIAGALFGGMISRGWFSCLPVAELPPPDDRFVLTARAIPGAPEHHFEIEISSACDRALTLDARTLIENIPLTVRTMRRGVARLSPESGKHPDLLLQVILLNPEPDDYFGNHHLLDPRWQHVPPHGSVITSVAVRRLEQSPQSSLIRFILTDGTGTIVAESSLLRIRYAE